MAAANEPPYLTVGTDVSARYKGAFCEAKVKKVNRLVKCRVIFEGNLGTMVLPDDQLRGTLRLNSYVEARHPEKNQYFRAIINKIFDYSQYTVVFDDGDETTLRRNSLCLKSGRHFAESDTLDRLPLTNPEHFGIPVLGSKAKRQRRSAPSCSSVDDESSSEGFSPKAKKKCIKKEQESDIAKVVCVDIGDKRKKDSWFPALVVSPSSQETKISPKDQYLVRSFKDGKYYPVKKKEARIFTKEIGAKVESNVLKTAVDKAMLYLNKDEIPPHWDWDTMMSQDVLDDEIKDSEVESSDDEPSEEKDRFVAQLYKFMDERGTPINRAPTISNRDLNLYKLFSIVQQMGGYNRVTNQNKWETVYTKMGLPMTNSACTVQIKKAYKRYLHSFEDFNRKLGCTMVCNTRSGHVRHRSDRNIIMTRKRDQNTPLPKSKAVKEIKRTTQDKAKNEESSERMVWSRSMTRAEEAEKQKKAKAAESKLEKMETRGSIKTDQEKSKESKIMPNKEKGKKEATIKTKDEKTKDKTPKNNGKEADRASKSNGKEADRSPKSNGKEADRASKSNGKEADRTPKSNGKEADRTPKSNGKEADRTPKSNGKEADRTPKSNGKEADRTPKSNGKDVDRTARSNGKESDRISKSNGKEADRSLKSNGKEAGKEKPVTLSPSKTKLEDEKDQQPRAKVEKSEDKEDTEKPLRSKECESKPKRNETNVRIGDRVKVKYGRGKQHKMYEAKVLKIERENGERKFYVHYTGWNTRYDEWIKKGRIIEVVEGKSLTAKNPRRSHSWQESQTKAILKRSMLFASPRKHCSTSSKASSGITLRARRQDSAPELRQVNINESRKLRSQLSEEPHNSDSPEKTSVPKSSPEPLERSSPLIDETTNKTIKLEEFPDPDKNVTEEGINDFMKDEVSLDVIDGVNMEEDIPLSITEIACKKEVTDNTETIKSADVVLKACTVNLSQESRNSIFPSDSSSKDEDSDECTNMKPIKTEPLDDYPDLLSLSKCSETNEDNFNADDQSTDKTNDDESNDRMKLDPSTFCDTSHCQKDEGNNMPSSVVDNDCLTKVETVNTKEHNNLTSEDQNEQDNIASLDRNNILSEIAEQLVDLNKSTSDNFLSDEDLPPPLDIKPDLISPDCEREVYETQPELKRAISEIEETQEIEICPISESTQDVCDKSELEGIQDKDEVDIVYNEADSGDSNIHSSPENLAESVVNLNEQENSIPDLKDEADEHITPKKEKKRSKFIKNETDNSNCGEEINETNDNTSNKHCKNTPKKKLDGTHDDGEMKKKSKKIKDKKKKLKKHKNLKSGDEKDNTKESQDGSSTKKEKKKKDDKIESSMASILGQKKGEISKKLKKCRKNKDKNSPRKNDSLAEKKIKRKKKKKDTGLIELDEKSNDQATSDSDKGTKVKKGKKKDKKKSKKKISETLELLDKVVEATTDIPDEKTDSKDEKGEKLEDPDATLESDEKIKEDEISFLLCQERVPASPLGNEFVEQEASSFALSGSEQNEMPVQAAIESSNYVGHSYSSGFPSLHAQNIHPLINKHTEMLTVLENTPPTTPESTGTLFSTSPSYDQEMLSPGSSVPHKDSPDTENDNSHEETSNMDIIESEDSRTESAILFLANQAVSRKKVLPSKRPAENSDILPPRKKKVTKFYSSEPINKPKSSSRASKGEQKDSDASSATGNSNNDSSSTSRQPTRTPRFNFYVPLDDTMDSDKRIAIIQNSLAELRKTYMALKAEVAMIDRHRKKAKRKEKEQAAANAMNSAAQKDGTDTS